MRSDVRRICALVSYDGTDFHGFQLQVTVPTVQGALEEALAQCAQTQCRIVGSGRTDTGVHATGQVVVTDVPWRHSLGDLQRAWNHFLPSSILIRQIAEAPEGFHPRFSATRRTYRYTVYHAGAGASPPPRFPIIDQYALIEPSRLDVETMNQAAQKLVGEHDFVTFGQPTQGDVTIRYVEAIYWQRMETNVPNVASVPFEPLVLTVTANAFLRRMARNFVGTLLSVGRGDLTPEDVADALRARDRNRSGGPVPAKGLVLERVEYEMYPRLFVGI